MTLTIQLNAETERRLREMATREGVDVGEFARRVIEGQCGSTHLDRAARARELFDQWAKEDSTSDPTEIASREAEFEEFKRRMNENRAPGRKLFP